MLKKSLVLGWAVALSFLFLSCKTGQPQEGPVPLAERFVHYGAGNPYLPLWEHLPDGEPRVFEDPDNPGKFRAYIIGSHDLRFTSYCGPDIRVWSAPVEDLSQWRDEGPVFTYEIEGKWDVMYAPDLSVEAFGSQKDENGVLRSNYTEGPWVYKRKDLYYLVYAAAGIPEYIAYSTAPSIEGPWTYQGYIMERAPHLAFTNHPGIIDFKGNSYFFYHTHELSNGEGFKRSVSVEPFTYNEDESIPLLKPTKAGVTESLSPLNPFQRVEAETMAWSERLKTTKSSKTGVYVSSINNGDYLMVRDVDFGDGAKRFLAGVASGAVGGSIELRLGALDGKLLGICTVSNTGGWNTWEVQAAKISKAKGVHDLYFVFKGGEGDLFNFDWWTLE